MKLLIAGKRDFEDKQYLEDVLDRYVSLFGVPDEVVHGDARGADTLGKEWAISRGYPVKAFPADWDKHGKPAGMIRNREMGKYADMLIAFWDGFSNGTAHMIQEMKKHKKQVIIVDTTETGIAEIFNTTWKFENGRYVWEWCGGRWELVWKMDSGYRLVECWYCVTDSRIESMCREMALNSIMAHEVAQRLPEGATYSRPIGAIYDGLHGSTVFFRGIERDDLERLTFSVCPSDTVSFGVL